MSNQVSIKLGENDVIRLKMSQYGYVQSARIRSKKFASIVTNNVCQLAATMQDGSLHVLSSRRERKDCYTDDSVYRRRSLMT